MADPNRLDVGRSVREPEEESRQDRGVPAETKGDLSQGPAEELQVKNFPTQLSEEFAKLAKENPEYQTPVIACLISLLKMGGDIAAFVEGFMPGNFGESLDKHEQLKDRTLNKEEKEKVVKAELDESDMEEGKKSLIGLRAERAYTQVACSILGINKVSEPAILAAKLKHSTETIKGKEHPYYKMMNFQALKEKGLVRGAVLIATKLKSTNLTDLTNLSKVKENLGRTVFVAINRTQYRGFDPESGDIKTFDINDKDSPISFKKLEIDVTAFVPNFNSDTDYFREKPEELDPYLDNSELSNALKTGEELIDPVVKNLDFLAAENEMSEGNFDITNMYRIEGFFSVFENFKKLEAFVKGNYFRELFPPRLKERMELIKKVLDEVHKNYLKKVNDPQMEQKIIAFQQYYLDFETLYGLLYNAVDKK